MRRTWPAAFLAAGVLALPACSSDDQQGATVPPPTVSSAQVPSPTNAAATPEQPEPSSAPDAGLAKGALQHVVRSGGLTVTVDYAAPPPVRWSADDGTSLQVSVTARDAGGSDRKVYLSKATLRFAADDGATSLAVPDPITDTATIDPGFLVNQPNQYVQVFSVPTIDSAAQELTITVKLEFVTLVDKKAKDYTKRTVTDTVRTTVA